jgi:hypothetical protein
MSNSVTTFQDLISSGVIDVSAQNFSLPSHCYSTQFESTKVKWFLVAWYCCGIVAPSWIKKFQFFQTLLREALTLKHAVRYKARKVV